MSEARVSVVVPAFNSERYLAEAVESALGQTHPPFEVIVVDDGSSDGTAEAAAAFGERIRYERQPNAGIGGARNTGVELASGDHLAFLDADDRWEPDKLERQLAALRSDPAPDIVLGHARQFVSPELSAQERAKLICPEEPQPGYLASCMLLSRATFERVGPFATELDFGEFIDWIARAKELDLRMLMLDATVLWRRLHDTNQGVRLRDRRGADYAQVIKASLDRRRAGGAL